MIEFGCKTEYQAPFDLSAFLATRRVGHKLSLIFGFGATIGEPLELITVAQAGTPLNPLEGLRNDIAPVLPPIAPRFG